MWDLKKWCPKYHSEDVVSHHRKAQALAPDSTRSDAHTGNACDRNRHFSRSGICRMDNISGADLVSEMPRPQDLNIRLLNPKPQHVYLGLLVEYQCQRLADNLQATAAPQSRQSIDLHRLDGGMPTVRA
jgi:hypothetical protein